MLVIHGTEDEVIDISHGVAIHEKCKMPVDPLYVEGAGHNDVEIYSQYVDRLKRFINEEIRNHQYYNQQQLQTHQLPPNSLTNIIIQPSQQQQQNKLSTSLTDLPALLREQHKKNDE